MRRTSGVWIALGILWACASGARADDTAVVSPEKDPSHAASAVQTEATPGSAGPSAVTPLPAVAPASPTAPSLLPRPNADAQSATNDAKSATDARTPIARRWWFWAGLGAAAVAVVVTAIAISPRDEYTGNANPGVVRVF